MLKTSLFRSSFFVLVAFVFQQCNLSTTTQFSEVSSAESGIDFLNEIVETEHNNIMTYEYTYNGGGVAVGDLNNDGYTDLYFLGNSVPNKLFLNKGNWNFEDITSTSHTRGRTDWATGVSMADVNGDGLLDIYVCYSGNAPTEGFNKPVIADYPQRANQLFINNASDSAGVPTFTEKAQEYGLDAPGSFSTQAYFFDYDLDGDLDMFLLNHANMFYSVFFNVQKLRNLRHPYFGNKLYRNDNNRFTEVSEEAGLHGSGLNFGLSAAISDINKDGWPDVYVTNDYDEQDFCYINNRNGTFKEVSHTSFDHLSKFGMGSDIADVNNDALPDVFVADMLPEDNYRQKILKGADEFNKYKLAVDSGYHHQYMRNTLQVHQGLAPDSLPRFSEIAQLSGVSNTDWSWAPLLADFNNDGYKDLFITNGYLRDFTNLDFVKYTVNKTAGKPNTDNHKSDLQELIQMMPSTKVANYAFANIDGMRFVNTTRDWGLDKPTISNAAAYADFDNDGDLDLVVNNLNEPASIFRNNQESLQRKSYLKIRLEGEGFNTFGLGAKVLITIADDKKLYYEAYYTRGYQSSVEPSLTIGLGEANEISKIEVIWPDGTITEMVGVKVNQELKLKQTDAVKNPPLPLKVSEPLFEDISDSIGLDFVHIENPYVDFMHQGLVPYQLSRLGGKLAIADVNGDGTDDVYFGGAAGQAGMLYLSTDDGTFLKSSDQPWQTEPDRAQEDIDMVFFDADMDGDQDLYVVSGGNEEPEGSLFYLDRLYLNDGRGKFSKIKGALPFTGISGGSVAASDFDKDGDMDLFVGGRISPRNYPFTPSSMLLRNDSKDGRVEFTDVTSEALKTIGMVSDAVWTDIDGDSWPDLVIVGEWMPITVFQNEKGAFSNITDRLKLDRSFGLWSCIVSADVDGDGDEDFLVGNAGLNTQFHATPEEPMIYYIQDINKDGKFDPIMSKYIQGKSYALASRDELLDQVTSLKKNYTTYDAYARETVEDILKKGEVSSTYLLNVNELRSSWLENLGKGEFHLRPLPDEAQVSMINGFVKGDFIGDRREEVLAAGNFYPYRVQWGRSDASKGLLMDFYNKNIQVDNANLWLDGDIRDIGVVRFNSGERGVVVSRNNGAAGLYKLSD